MLFGLGWAIAGPCPAPALVMISSGALLGLVAIPGIFLGLHLRERQMGSIFHVGDGEHREEVGVPTGDGGCSGRPELPVGAPVTARGGAERPKVSAPVGVR